MTGPIFKVMSLTISQKCKKKPSLIYRFPQIILRIVSKSKTQYPNIRLLKGNDPATCSNCKQLQAQREYSSELLISQAT